MQDIPTYCLLLGQKARAAAALLATVNGAQKNRWLERTADAVESRTTEILRANARDLEAAVSSSLTAAQVERLRLSSTRVQAAATGLRQIAALADPVGRVLEGGVRPNGLQIQKIAVPIGTIFFIYESRPNVTLDAAALCVKSGNAIILRGGKEALHSNMALHRILQDCLQEAGLPTDAVQLVTTTDRSAITHLLGLPTYIDLAIPRGGEGLIRRVCEEARMPVLKHDKGNCHVYVDRAADLEMAERILINAKCQRPGVCNAAESLLVHRDVAAAFLPKAAQALRDHGVELRGCEETRRYSPDAVPATEADYAAEYLDLILSIRVVPDINDALAHIARYGSGHTEAIVTGDLAAAHRFTTAVDASAVMVNASTRFNDGFEFGLGAEIGISTNKFHARGPCGLLELTTYKYIVQGAGHLRS